MSERNYKTAGFNSIIPRAGALYTKSPMTSLRTVFCTFISLATSLSGLKVRWFNGSVARLIDWFDGSMDHWFISPMDWWFDGLVVHLFVGSMDWWFDGSLVQWIVGSMDWWFDGSGVQWFACLMDRWFDGSVVCWFDRSLI